MGSNCEECVVLASDQAGWKDVCLLTARFPRTTLLCSPGRAKQMPQPLLHATARHWIMVSRIWVKNSNLGCRGNLVLRQRPGWAVAAIVSTYSSSGSSPDFRWRLGCWVSHDCRAVCPPAQAMQIPWPYSLHTTFAALDLE